MKAEVLKQNVWDAAKFAGSRILGGGWAEFANITDPYVGPLPKYNFDLIGDLKAANNRHGLHHYFTSRIAELDSLETAELEGWRETYPEQIEWASRVVAGNHIPYSGKALPDLEMCVLDAEVIVFPNEPYAQVQAA